MIPAGFLTAIIIGTLLLKLPMATRTGFISWIDALFTAVSAVCVTGLIVVDTGSYFTVFGQIVILAMIQIGGLGVMSLAVIFFRLIWKSISVNQWMLVQRSYSSTPRKDIHYLLASMVIFTFLAELTGAIILFAHWSRTMPAAKAAYSAVFHSISAFCNAGFSIYSDSLCAFRGDIVVNSTVMFLIILGGIGFPVVYDFFHRLKHGKSRRKLSVQTKTVLTTTLILIIGGALFLCILEYHRLPSGFSHRDFVLITLFQSVTARTAGFNTLDIGSFSDASLMVLIFLMFCGASPGSCGGGIKTTTLAVIAVFIMGEIRRNNRTNLFYRSIPEETVRRSMALVVLSGLIIFIALFFIIAGDEPETMITATHHEMFPAYLFEAVSAFGTVGLSMGITPHFGPGAKLWIIILMFIGRVGVLTFAYIIAGSGSHRDVLYAEEDIMIG